MPPAIGATGGAALPIESLRGVPRESAWMAQQIVSCETANAAGAVL